MTQKYQLIIEGQRTIKVTIYANSYEKAQQRAIEMALEYFPHTTANDWEILETLIVKKVMCNRRS